RGGADCDLKPNAGSEKCWVWLAEDFSDEEHGAYEQFALKFGKAELASAFKEAFDSAKELNSKVPGFVVEGGKFVAQANVAKAEDAASGPSPAPDAVINPFSGMSIFGNSAPSESLFGNAFAGPAASGLFASSAASSGGLFGGSSGNPQTGGLFSSISGSVFSSNGSSGGGLFGTAATSGSLFSQPAQNGGGIFGGGSALPATTQPAADGDGGDDGEYVQEEEVTTVEGWTPSITLEVKESVEMGTEQEDEIYSQRSKLYRFVDGEWKERGLGDAKLLKHKDTGKVRFLLRQEKTMKIVANHIVIEHDVYCRLEKNADSDKIWVWSALDWADEEQSAEKFGLKFGNVEVAGKFKDAFENAKQINAKAGGTSSAKAPSDEPAPPVSGGGAASGSGLFASSAASSGGLFGGSSSNPQTGGLFSSISGSVFSSNGSSGGGLFGTAATSGSLFSQPAQNGGGIFGGGAAQPAPTQPAGGGDGGDDGEYVQEEEVTTVEGWTPSITLEVKESVEMGTEQEDEIYSQRSKLYRFVDGEWKERGLGDAKLLKHKDTGKVRFLLRQEKTMKIVANHIVIEHDVYCRLEKNADSDKIWVWSALDWADEEQSAEKFGLKFGNVEVAGKFKDAFENAKQINAKAGGTSSAKASSDEPAPPVSSGGAASGSGLFASSAASSGGLFGGSSGNPQTGGLFSSISGSVFSSNGSSGGGLFGTAATSGSLFSQPAQNGGGIFGGGAAQPAPTQPAGGGDGGDDGEYVQEEEVTTVEGWTPSITLEVKESVEMGTEQEDEIYSQRSKLYRFVDGEWKERGLGDAKLLKHKDTGKVRFLLRQEKTMKIVANHIVIEHDVYCRLEKNADSDKIWVWSALDWADEEQSAEKFGLKFGNVEVAGKFKDAFENAKQINAKAGGTSSAKASSDEPAPPVSGGGAASGSGLFASSAASSGGLFGGSSGTPQTGGLFSSLATSTGSALAGGGQSAAGAAPAADEDEEVVEEEVTTIPGWAPSVNLEVLDQITTGEEEEEEIYSQRSKLYRFRDGEWKERGLGDAKLLKHKTSSKVRFMLRQEKTMKIVANHFALAVGPLCDLQPNMGSEKCWQWMAQDYSEDEPVVEQFGLKFGSAELAGAFKEAFDGAKEQNLKVKEFADKAAGTPREPAAKKEEPKPQPASLFGGASGGAPAGTNPLVGLRSPPEVSCTPAASSGSGLFGGLGSGGGAAPSTSGSLFGGAATTGGGSLLGGPAATGGSLFGGAASSGSLFGGAASSGSLFGGAASSGSLFGGAASSGSLFGGAASSGSLFGGSASSGSLFGGAASSGSLFGGAASSGSLFGGSASSSGGLFGSSAPSGSLFGGSASSGSLFGSSASSGAAAGAAMALGATPKAAPAPPKQSPAPEVDKGGAQKESTTGKTGGKSPLELMAEQQQKDNWRCDGCYLQYPTSLYECGVCEIARPGYEDRAAEEKAKKQQGSQSAAAAFLGTGQATTTAPAPAPAPPASSGAPLFGFATGAPAGAPAVPAPGAAAPVFGFAAAAPAAAAAAPPAPPPPAPGQAPPAAQPAAGFGFHSPGAGLPPPPAPPAAGAYAPPPPRQDAAWPSRPLEDEPGSLRQVESALRRLEDRVDAAEERARRAEERARRAEEQARRAEEELGSLRPQLDQLSRRQQEDRALQQELAERGRRAGEELGGLRPQVDQLARRQQEDGVRLRSLQDQLAEARESLTRDLTQELRSSRGSWEASSQTMQKALQVSNQALQVSNQAFEATTALREEYNAFAADTTRVNKQRFEDLASLGDQHRLEAVRGMSLPSRIMYLQSQHMQQLGQQLGSAPGAQQARGALSIGR
ncbi:unnamed protein product, partial [Prorocentrum cordatum]